MFLNVKRTNFNDGDASGGFVAPTCYLAKSAHFKLIEKLQVAPSVVGL